MTWVSGRRAGARDNIIVIRRPKTIPKYYFKIDSVCFNLSWVNIGCLMFKEAAQLKTSLAKYSINASASNSVFEAVRQTLHITVCEKVGGQTRKDTEEKDKFCNDIAPTFRLKQQSFLREQLFFNYFILYFVPMFLFLISMFTFCFLLFPDCLK